MNKSGIDQKLVSGVDQKNGVDQNVTRSYLRETRGGSRLSSFLCVHFLGLLNIVGIGGVTGYEGSLVLKTPNYKSGVDH